MNLTPCFTADASSPAFHDHACAFVVLLPDLDLVFTLLQPEQIRIPQLKYAAAVFLVGKMLPA